MKADSSSAQDYCKNLLASMVDIPSVYLEEEELMLFLERELTTLGLRPQRIDLTEHRFNLLCTVGKGSPRICLNAHGDTVPPNGESVPVSRIQGDTVFGLGACDTKASIASMVTAYLDLAAESEKLPGTADLLISVDEELDGLGVKTAISEGYSCDYAIVGEPTGLNIVSAHNGLLFLSLTTMGKSAHGCHPSVGINAIERMMALVDEICGAIVGFPEHLLLGGPSLNLGEIHAGDRPNRVPDKCVARIDIRFPPPTTNAQVLDAAQSIIAGYDWASFEIEKRGETLDTPADSPLIRAIQDTAQGMGVDCSICGLRGWTEAEPFHNMLGIDAVVFGPGDVKLAHSAHELVSISETQRAAVMYADIVRRLMPTG